MLFLIDLGWCQTYLKFPWTEKKKTFCWALLLAWLLALSSCGEGCTDDEYILGDAVSHLPCCRAHDQFNILAVLLLLAWELSLEARGIEVGDVGWRWTPGLGSRALVGCPTLFFYRKAMSAESYSALCCLPQFFSKNHSFPGAFTSFSAAPAEQKAGALQHPFIFAYEILCTFNYFYK